MIADLPIGERQVRIFVSSTFRDMQEDRDELVKRVFPALRKLCDARGVAWSEVDLRWGITDEQQAEGAVLPICLEEIRRCRPYFLGLLGERYGWIPEEIPPGLIAAHPWLERTRGRSVTELEILHGVLADPEMQGHAFFYFRDPGYAERRSSQERPWFTEEAADPATAAAAAERRRKLESLKERIRRSGHLVRESYPDPRTLGEWVREDLTALVERLFPAEEVPDWLAREGAVHAAFARSRTAVWVPRPDLFGFLDAHLAGEGPPLVVCGEAGTGKSALLANWAASARHRFPGTPVLAHHAGAGRESADWAAMVRRLVGEAGRAVGADLPIPDAAPALRQAFADAIRRTASGCILVIDGLDRLEDRDGAPDLVFLPEDLPPRVRLILSTRPGRPLEATWRRGWQHLEMAPLDGPLRGEIARRTLAFFAKALSPALLARIEACDQAASPLFVRVLVDELRQHGVHETLGARLDGLLAASDVPALFEQVLGRWEADYERDRPGLVGEALGLLWAARRGLSEAELRDLLGYEGNLLPAAHWSPLALAAEELLLARSGLLDFGHDHLRDAVERRYLESADARRRAHERLAGHFQGDTLRCAQELPWHLAEAGQWRRLASQLARPHFLDALAEISRWEVHRYLARLDREAGIRSPDVFASLLADPLRDAGHSWRVATLLADLGHPDEAFSLRSALACHFREIGDAYNLQAALGNLALTLRNRGEVAAAADLFAEQEALCREIGYPVGLQAALGYRALLAAGRGDLAAGLELLTEQEGLCRDLGARGWLQSCLGNQATIRLTRGEYAAALALLAEQERLCQELGHVDGLQAAIGNQGLVYKELGALDLALELHRREEAICRDTGSRMGLQASLGNQALILKALGDLPGALALHRDEEEICRALGHLEGLEASLGNQALVLKATGDFAGALRLMAEQERICRDLGNAVGLQASLGNQALVHLARGAVAEAAELASLQEVLCRQVGNPGGLQAALDNLGMIHAAAGRFEEAGACYREAEELCRAVGLPDGLQEGLGHQGELALLLGDPEEALRLTAEQEEVCRAAGLREGLCRALLVQGRAIAILRGPFEARFLLEEAAALAAEAGLRLVQDEIDAALERLA